MSVDISLFLQAAPGGGGYGSLIMIGAMILVFWLFMIRPQMKKTREQKKFIGQIEKGDKVVTLSGMHGMVSKLNDDNTSFILEALSNQQIKMERSAISYDLTKMYYPKGGDTPSKKS